MSDNDGETVYTYDADGLRTSKTGSGCSEQYVYDGDPDLLPTSYIRGLGLIAARTDKGVTYYHYNAHGDVVHLTDANGAVVKDYTYDAFGVEQNASDTDTNPFRYCGEQYDAETGNYYLRARYYTPGTGRFGQEDTHWNPGNMVHGDDPQKWNEYQSWLDESERDDPLGLHTYTYKPEATAVAQAGNLYAYGLNNPIYFVDFSGRSAAAAAALSKGLSMAAVASQLDSPAPGPADVVAAIIAGGTVIYAGGVWVHDTFFAKPSSDSTMSGTGSGEAASGGPNRNQDNKGKGNWKSVTKQQLKKLNKNAHEIKREYLGRRAEISRYDLVYDTKSGAIGIMEKSTGKIIETYYFISR